MRQIYVLEDNKDIGYILELLLVNEGYAVEVFENVERIEAKLPDQLPDLFLLDIMLPDGNGLALCQEIKENPVMQHLPVVMMSANMDPKLVAPEVKTDGFIAKPFDLYEVAGTLNSLLDPRLN